MELNAWSKWCVYEAINGSKLKAFSNRRASKIVFRNLITLRKFGISESKPMFSVGWLPFLDECTVTNLSNMNANVKNAIRYYINLSEWRNACPEKILPTLAVLTSTGRYRSYHWIHAVICPGWGSLIIDRFDLKTRHFNIEWHGEKTELRIPANPS